MSPRMAQVSTEGASGGISRDLVLVSIVVPVYNEEMAIGDDLDIILSTMDETGIDYELIVVDDGSTDQSARIVRERGRVRLIQHPMNQGVGAARTAGMRQARGQIIVTTDGDGTYPNQDIPRLLAHMGEYDMVIGARTREAGSLPWLRGPAKAFIRLLASYLTGTRIPDLNSGLRCFRREVAERFLPLLPSGHSWESTITLAFLTSGYKVHFLPVDYYQRKGRSTFRPIQDTLNYLRLVGRTVMYFDPLKVLGPIALALLGFGGLKLVRDIIVYDWRVPTNTVIILMTGMQIGALALLADLIVRRGGRGP